MGGNGAEIGLRAALCKLNIIKLADLIFRHAALEVGKGCRHGVARAAGGGLHAGNLLGVLYLTGAHEDVGRIDDMIAGQLFLHILQDAGKNAAFVDRDRGALGKIRADRRVPSIGAGRMGLLLIGHDLFNKGVALIAVFKAKCAAVEVDLGVKPRKFKNRGQLGIANDIDILVLRRNVADGALRAGQDILIDANVAGRDVIQVSGQGRDDHIRARFGASGSQSFKAIFFQFHFSPSLFLDRISCKACNSIYSMSLAVCFQEKRSTKILHNFI